MVMGRPLYSAAVVSSFLFFLTCCQLSQIGCVPYFHTWCSLSANLECPARGALKIEDAQVRRLRIIAQRCRVITSQLWHVSTIEKKLVKQQYLLHVYSQYGELGPLTAEIGTPADFNWFWFQRVLCLDLHSTEAPRTFAWVAITLGCGPHCSFHYNSWLLSLVINPVASTSVSVVSLLSTGSCHNVNVNHFL